jgi:hypothetical protein
MTHKQLWTVAEVLQKLCSFCILKMMITLFTKSFVEELMVKSSPSSPPGIRTKEHKMVIVKNQIVSDVRLGSIAIDSRLLVDKLLDHIWGAQNYSRL